jgi:hypothetical protein
MKFPDTFKENRGFTLLLAALIASIVLSLGAAIFTIAQKQLQLSSVGRNSQFAFYAADTAAECALYWDVRFAYFAATSTYNGSPTCDGQAISATVTSGTRSSGNFTMSFSYAPNSYCAKVSVTKSLSTTTSAITSVVHSDGYSTPCATIQTDPNALQRSVELHY